VILREPVGVVGVITPWNYPLLMAAWKIAPILAAGNSIVMKPSEQTPLSTLKLAELVAGRIPDGILNVVTGRGRTVGQRLSEHPDIALVALTGSVVSGQAVAETAAKSVKRVHLELGGKAPCCRLPRRRPPRRSCRCPQRRLLERRPGLRRRLPGAGARVRGRRVHPNTWCVRSAPRFLALRTPGTTSKSAP
jgi:hypothetical protein